MSFKKASKEFVLSDSSVNTYGYRLLTSGYDLAAFEANPIGYYMHKRDDGVTHKWEDLKVVGDKLMGVPVINMSNARGQQTLDEIENGFLNAASVGHIVVLESSMDPKDMIEGQTGPTITKWYNREASLVDVPGNVNSLGHGLYDVDGAELNLADMMKPVQLENLNANNSMEIKLTPEAFQALNLAAGSDAGAINGAVMALASKNNSLQTQLTALTDKAATDKVADLLAKALNVDKKITKEFSNLMATKYAKDPEGLELVLNAMPGFAPVAAVLERQEVNADKKVQDLVAQGWDKLHKENKLIVLKNLSAEAFEALYEEKHGHKPNAKPLPKLK